MIGTYSDTVPNYQLFRAQYSEFELNAIIYRAVYPPSTGRHTPVTQLASSLARTTAILAISLGNPGPLNGWRLFKSSNGVIKEVVSANIAVCVSRRRLDLDRKTHYFTYIQGRVHSHGFCALHSPLQPDVSNYWQLPSMHNMMLGELLATANLKEELNRLTMIIWRYNPHYWGHINNPPAITWRVRLLPEHLASGIFATQEDRLRINVHSCFPNIFACKVTRCRMAGLQCHTSIVDQSNNVRRSYIFGRTLSHV